MFDRSVVAGVCPMIDRIVCRSFRRLTESSVCRLICVGTMVFVGCQSCSSSVRRRFVVGSSSVRRRFVFGSSLVRLWSFCRISFLVVSAFILAPAFDSTELCCMRKRIVCSYRRLHGRPCEAFYSVLCNCRFFSSCRSVVIPSFFRPPIP